VIKSKVMRWVGLVALGGGQERCIQGFSGKPEGKKLLGRFMLKWKNNIKMDFQGMG
jgi:hypothetical protein